MSRKIYKSVAELIGNTPLLEVTGLEKELKLDPPISAAGQDFSETSLRKTPTGEAP